MYGQLRRVTGMASPPRAAPVRRARADEPAWPDGTGRPPALAVQQVDKDYVIYLTFGGCLRPPNCLPV
jgi:hypothetical protein